jgi:hypothetical protein
MLEPTWNSISLPGARLTGGHSRRRVNRRSAAADAPNKQWLVCAAPFSVAAVWIAATGASFLVWSITGRRELLDWCRSGGILTASAALAALAALVASLLNGGATGPFRFVSRERGASPLASAPQSARQLWLDDRATADD